MKDCLQKKNGKKKRKRKKKGDRQRPIPSLFLISVPNINNFTLISSLTFISPCILVIFNAYYMKLRLQRKNPVAPCLRSLWGLVIVFSQSLKAILHAMLKACKEIKVGLAA